LRFVSKDETQSTRKRKARTPSPGNNVGAGGPGSSVSSVGSIAPGATRRKIVHWLLVFVASIVLVDGLVGERGLLAMLRARHEYDELSASISRERANNSRLREEARRLNDDPSAIEEIARRELGLIKPGEKVFIVRDAAPARP
jgi:cell division protein FtsB